MKKVNYVRGENKIEIFTNVSISPNVFGRNLISLMGTKKFWEPIMGESLDFMFSGYVIPEVKIPIYSTDKDALNRELLFNPELSNIKRKRPNGLLEYLVPILTIKSKDLNYSQTGEVSSLILEREPALAERKFRNLAKMLKSNNQLFLNTFDYI